MIALDTNVLVRFVIQDDVEMAERAKNVIQKLTIDKPAFISIPVLCEFIWV
jgi:predicted nucleic-acid-binding protein